MSRTPYRLLALSLAIALTVSACGGGEQEGPQGGPGQVTVATLKGEQVSLTRELPGRTNAFLVAEVRPQVSGIVAKRLFTEGSLPASPCTRSMTPATAPRPTAPAPSSPAPRPPPTPRA